MHPTIRPVAEADLQQIRRIDRAAFSADEQYEDGMYEEMLESGLSVTALDDVGAIVGYAFVQMNPYTHIRSLAVHPESQRKGYGKAMLPAIIAHADCEVDLLVDEANVPAMALYRKLGFEPAEMCPTLPPKRRLVLRIKKA
jgi:ribosomal-protein-alanine N-acetyltransferase